MQCRVMLIFNGTNFLQDKTELREIINFATFFNSSSTQLASSSHPPPQLSQGQHPSRGRGISSKYLLSWLIIRTALLKKYHELPISC